MKNFRRVLIGLLLPFMLCTCGWHLRGHLPDTTPLTRLHLEAQDPYSLLYRHFQQELQKRHISSSMDKGVPRIRLLDEQLTRHIVSLNTELDPAEEELTLTVHYLLNGLPQQVETHSTLPQNKHRIAAREDEIKYQQQYMRQELINRILQQASLLTNQGHETLP
jgi:outer membrane lipopolysaccharide assembly protein LptE/RlpB